jgi:transmembrane sensor
MNRDRLTFLFQKYADKSSTKEEYAEFMNFINEESSTEELDFLLNAEWEAGVADQMLDHQKADLIFNQVLISDQQQKKSFSLKFSWAAAAAVVAIGLSVWLYQRYQAAPLGQRVASRVAPAPVAQVMATDEHKQVRLPDGSIVILNRKSTLSFIAGFSGQNREVTLKGEGYFDIKHDARRPFIVHTGKIKTTVLGTAFNIKAYDQDQGVIVSVTRGKVMVQDEEKTLGVLVPNQQIVFNKVQNNAVLAKVQARQVIEWQEKDLFFDDVTMLDAAEILSKRFNVQISFANENVRSCRFTATFLKGEKLDEILQIITSFNHAEYKLKSGEILISGKGCK